MAYVGNPGANKIITTDAGGKLTPGTVGSGMSLTAGTLTAGVTVAFDCDFTLLSNQPITGSTIITDQESRSLTFTPSFVGTASMAIANGSGLGFTTASSSARSRIFTPCSGFNRNAFFGSGYRIWMRWASYAPLGASLGLFTGMYLEPSAGNGTIIAENFRQNAVGPYNNNGPLTYNINFPTADATYNVLVLEQSGGVITTFYGYPSSGFPTYNSLYALGNGDVRNLSTTIWQNRDISTHGVEIQFANLVDNTSRTMYCTNLLIETLL